MLFHRRPDRDKAVVKLYLRLSYVNSFHVENGHPTLHPTLITSLTTSNMKVLVFGASGTPFLLFVVNFQ